MGPSPRKAPRIIAIASEAMRALGPGLEVCDRRVVRLMYCELVYRPKGGSGLNSQPEILFLAVAKSTSLRHRKGMSQP